MQEQQYQRVAKPAWHFSMWHHIGDLMPFGNNHLACWAGGPDIRSAIRHK
jgi:hypothetical protein